MEEEEGVVGVVEEKDEEEERGEDSVAEGLQVEECPRETSFHLMKPIYGRVHPLSKQLFHQDRHQHAPDSHGYSSRK